MTEKGSISSRQGQILAAIVKEYSETGEPVASSDLSGKYGFEVSGATIRNDMQVLEKQGYITQPHTSAGRIPTDQGYRFFVNELMAKVKLSLHEQERLRREVVKLQAVNTEIGRRLAKILSEVSSNASFVLSEGESSSVGLSRLLANPQLEPEDAKEIAEFFDHLDEHAGRLMKEFSGRDPKALIGHEVTMAKGDYSMVVSGLTLPSGKPGLVGLIGPKSMKYEKNMSLLEYVVKLFGGSASVVTLFFLLH